MTPFVQVQREVRPHSAGTQQAPCCRDREIGGCPPAHLTRAAPHKSSGGPGPGALRFSAVLTEDCAREQREGAQTNAPLRQKCFKTFGSLKGPVKEGGGQSFT